MVTKNEELIVKEYQKEFQKMNGYAPVVKSSGEGWVIVTGKRGSFRYLLKELVKFTHRMRRAPGVKG